MLLYELFSDRDLDNVEATLQSLILLDPGSMTDALSTTAFAYETDPATGTDQQLMVTMGSSHPFALWFPGRVQPTAAEGGLLVKSPLHKILGPLASACARPVAGLLESMATHRPSLDDLQRGVTLLAVLYTEKGLLIVPITVPHFRDLCDTFLLQHVDRLAISPLDLTHVPLNLAAAFPVSSVLVASSIGPRIRGSRLLHAYGDLTELVGSHYVEATKRGVNPGSAGAQIEYVMTQVDEALDSLKPNRPSSLARRVTALHQFLQDSRWPPLLQPLVDTEIDMEDEIYERTTFYSNSTKQVPGDDMVSLLRDKFAQILQRPEAADLLSFLLKGSAAPGEDPAHFNQLRTLLPLTEGTAGVKDLNSVQNLEMLILLITKSRATWSSHRFSTCSDVKALVNMLYAAIRQDRQMEGKGSSLALQAGRASEASVDAATDGRTFQGVNPRVSERLLAVLNDSSFTWVEDRLAAHQRGLPPPPYEDAREHAKDLAIGRQKNLPLWYRPIRDVMHSNSAIAKRVILGAVKNLPREISTFLNDLRRHFDAFFRLRLVWNEVSPLTTRMLQFTVNQQVVKAFTSGNFHAGKKVNILVQIWLEVRIKIQKAADRPAYSVDRDSILTDSRMLSKYKTLFDRALGAIGYPSVEQHGALATSHAAAMDYLGDFLELGEPLSGVRLRNHLHFAMQFIDNFETEAAVAFKHFLDSQDPAAMFPAVFLDVRGAAMMQLLDHKVQLEKMMEISDYAGELLSHAQPTPGKQLCSPWLHSPLQTTDRFTPLIGLQE